MKGEQHYHLDTKKTARGQQWSAIPSALPYTFREPEMCTAGQMVLLSADHYWPRAVFFFILKLMQGSGSEGDDVL